MQQMGLIFAIALIFFALERLQPGRELPESPGWYARAVFLNAWQLGIVMLAGVSWNRWLQSWSVCHMAAAMPPVLQGFLGWFIGTFVFYWWHRARHDVTLSLARMSSDPPQPRPCRATYGLLQASNRDRC